MKNVNVYLNFPGNAEEAFNYYKSLFGGQFTSLMRFKDTPEAGNVSDSEKEKIMHIALPIGNQMVLMATDTIESMNQKVVVGNNIYLSIDTESKDETNNLFEKLSSGGKIEMPLQDTFWNAYFGMTTDKFGIKWMLGYEYKK